MTGSILLYGATGYTGKLIAREARAKGASAVLAGRNPNMLKAVAKGLDLPWRTFDLADRAKLDAALKGVSVVLNAAGPFSATARPIADACLGKARIISTSPARSTCSRASSRATPRRSGPE